MTEFSVLKEFVLKALQHGSYSYGVPYYEGTALVFDEALNTISVIYRGEAVIDIFSDGSALISIPQQYRNGKENFTKFAVHLSHLFGGTSVGTYFSIKKKERVNAVTCLLTIRTSKLPERTYEFVSKIKLVPDVSYGFLGDTSIDDVLNVDTDRKKDIYTKLRKMAKLIRARIRMGAYNKVLCRPPLAAQHALQSGGARSYIGDDELRAIMYVVVNKWIDTQDDAQLAEIAQLIIALDEPWWRDDYLPEHRQLAAIPKAITWLQQQFSRNECATIASPTTEQCTGEEDGSNQDMVVQSADGFRDLQVQGEAEVCRSDP